MLVSRSHMLRFFVAASLLIAAGGCKTMVPCQTRDVHVTFAGSPPVNPDDQGRSLPTFVRVFQLKSTSRFENATFEELWKEPKKVLGDELLDSGELTVHPEKEEARKYERKAPTSEMAAIAVFRKPEGGTWKATLQLPNDTGITCPEKEPKPAPFELRVLLDGYRVEMRQEK